MKPISHERIQWLQERLKVVESSIRVAQSSMYSSPAGKSELQRALIALGSERVLIEIELKVLTEMNVLP